MKIPPKEEREKEEIIKEIEIALGLLSEQGIKPENLKEEFFKQHPNYKDFEPEIDNIIKTLIVETSQFTPLHAGGGIIGKLVYEPIGNYEYVWKLLDKKGISAAIFDKRTEDNPEGTNKWVIEIDGKKYPFNSKPHFKLPFFVPERKNIELWIDNQITSKSSLEIYQEMRKTVKICLDLLHEYEYDIKTIGLFESWLSEILEALAYVNIVGGVGSGKTTALEALKMIARHGMMAGDISEAGIGRMIDEFKLTTFYDEFDVGKEKDDDSQKIARQSYRRENFYIRIKPKTLEPDISDPFGMKIFSVHSEQEKALKTRGLPVYMAETQDKKIPIINLFKRGLGHKIATDIFFWYLDNITNIEFIKIDWDSIDLNQDIEEIRKQIYEQAVSCLNEKEKQFLDFMKGRNIELGYITLTIAKAIGISDTILDNLIEAFEVKTEVDAEEVEKSWAAFLKDLLIDVYEQNKNDKEKVTDDGVVFELNKVVFDRFNEILTTNKNNPISPYRFKGILRDFGFIDRVNYKKKEIEEDGKKKSIFCLFFDKRVLDKLTFLTFPTFGTFPTPEQSPIEGSSDVEKSGTIPVSQESKESKESQESISNNNCNAQEVS